MNKIIKMARPLNLFFKKLDSLKLACIEYVSSLRDDVDADVGTHVSSHVLSSVLC